MDETNPKYSSHLGLTVAFAALVVLQAIYVVEDFQERRQLQSLRTTLAPALRHAQTVAATVENVGRELIDLSTTNKEAALIVDEFKLRINAAMHPANQTSRTESDPGSSRGQLTVAH